MTYPLIQARYYSTANNLPVTRVVMHATVSPCVPGGAANVARYFQSAQAGGSAHYVVDPEGIVACVPETQTAYHAPPNHGSIGVELCDPQTGPASRWGDGQHTAMLSLAAGLVRDLCVRYGLPVVWLSPADLLAGRHGITGHAEVSAAWHESDHTDPGAGFPVTGFLASVAGQHQEDDMDDTQAGQLTAVAQMAPTLYVDTLYRIYGGRDPDPEGFEYWVGQLQASNPLSVFVRMRALFAAEPKAKAGKG